MSIDIEIGSTLSRGDAAHLAATAEAITLAMHQIRELHGAYSWVWTDEIRCRGCNTSLDVPILASTNANAEKALQAHQDAQLEAFLASGSAFPAAA